MKAVITLFKKHWFFISFLLIFSLAIFLRFFRLGQVPVSLYWDEVAMLADARIVAQTGQDMHGKPWLQSIFLSYGDYKLPVYIWLASLSVKLFGVTELALRLPSALAGLGTIGLSVLIARQLSSIFNFKANKARFWMLTAGLIATISPWSILFSRTGFEGHLGQFFLSLAVWLLLVKKHNLLTLVLAQLAASLATYTYFSVRFVWPVVFVTAILILLWPQLKRSKKNWLKLILSLTTLGLFFVSLQPMVNSEFYQASNQYRLSTDSVLNIKDWAIESNQLREMAGNTKLSRFIYHRHLLMLKELAKNFADHLSINFLFINGDSNLRHGTGQHGLFLWPLLPFLFLGLFYSAKKSWRFLTLLGVWWLAALLPASVPETTPHALRSLNALMPLVLILSLGLTEFFSSISVKKAKKFLIAFSLILLVSLVGFIHHYFSAYPKLSASEWQAGYKQVALIVSQEAVQADQVHLALTDNRYFLWFFAYGPYSAQEIQQVMANIPQPEKIRNIHFTNFSWVLAQPSKQKPKDKIIVTTQSELGQQVLEPDWIKEIETKFSQKKYVMIGSCL